MFNELTNIIIRSLKLDKTLYKESRSFNELSIYFALIIMILDGISGAVAASSVIKTNIFLSGITAILTSYIWALLIYVIAFMLNNIFFSIIFKKLLKEKN